MEILTPQQILHKMYFCKLLENIHTVRMLGKFQNYLLSYRRKYL